MTDSKDVSMSNGQVVHFPIGTVGVDKTGAVITSTVAKNLYGLGYRFALRSIGIAGSDPTSTGQSGQLTSGELTNICSAGLAVSVFQLNFKQTVFSSETGTNDATYLVDRVQAMGFPVNAGFTLWFDLEYMGGTESTLLAYVNAWGQTVVKGGYAAGMYTGAGSPLSGTDISNLADFHAYWQAGQRLTYAMPARGYQMYQLYPASQSIGGTLVDVDVVQHDFDGDAPPFWLASSTAT
ncbi:MAG: DUF1906 domain-containing protein [Polyangiaceae bacterium]|nr:DUF1906 domain-containing protein [Polyangiaceae bacterium]